MILIPIGAIVNRVGSCVRMLLGPSGPGVTEEQMRWELLFDDLAARLDAEESLERQAEVADRTRRERAQLGLHQRLAAARGGSAVSAQVAGLGRLHARVLDVGADWVLFGTSPERGALVPFAALRSLGGLVGRAGPVSTVAKGFTLGAALRAVSRDRAPVALVDVDGARLTGTIDAVGQDALDLAEHPLDLPRRAEHVTDVRVVPFPAIGAVLRE